MGERIALRVDEGGQRVDRFLAERSLLSRSAIARLAKDGHVLVDGNAVAYYKACAGPPEGYGDRGHTAVPTPAGEYVLGEKQSHVTMSWPSSAIPWAAMLRERADGVIEYSTNATDWMPATSNRLRQRTFLQPTRSSVRTM